MPLSRDPAKRQKQLQNLRPAPPAPEGHTRSLVHGGRARKATLILAGSWAERIMAELEAEAPLRGPHGELPERDRQIVELLASALARLQSVTAWLEVRPAVDERGRPWPAEDTARRLRSEAARYIDQLGMTPKSAAALGLDLVRSAATAEEAEANRAARERLDAKWDTINGEAEEASGDG